MGKLKINWEELLLAFDLDLPEFEVQWFLDIDTGATICLNDFDDEATRTQERQLVESDADRFVKIIPIDEEQIIDLMTRFSIDIRDKNIKELAWLALDGSNAIKDFRKALVDFPNTWESWKYFRRRAISELIMAFLTKYSIEPENPSPYL